MKMIKEILEEIKRVGNATTESFFYIRFHNSIVVYLIYLK